MYRARRLMILGLAVILLLSALLSGCRSEPEPADMYVWEEEITAPTEPIPITEPKNIFHRDNVHGAYPSCSVYPAGNDEGFYFSRVGTDLCYYYSFSEKSTIRMCSRPGCKHKDESCLSYISDLTCILEANGTLYAFCQDELSVRLLKIDPATGDRSTFYAWEGSVGEKYYILNDCFYSCGRIFTTVNMVDGLSTILLQSIDLRNGALTTIAESSDLGSGEFLGAYGNYAFINWYGLTEELPKMEDYLKEHPNETELDYYSYINRFQKEHTGKQIRKYDLITGEHEDVYSLLQMGGTNAPDFNLTGSYCAFGKYLLYSLGKTTVCRYDMNSGEARELLTVENLWGAKLVDDRLLYWLLEEEQIKVRLRDVDTGEELIRENEGDNKALAFTVLGESATSFHGVYDDKLAWISKEDYYAEKYNRSVFYPT